MNLSTFREIGSSLAKQTSIAISKEVIFEPTGIKYDKKQMNESLGRYHFRMLQADHITVRAWINWRKTLGLARLGIRGDFLPTSGHIITGMKFKPNANYKCATEGGPGEWTLAIRSVNEMNYKIALEALRHAFS